MIRKIFDLMAQLIAVTNEGREFEAGSIQEGSNGLVLMDAFDNTVGYIPYEKLSHVEAGEDAEVDH